tara:strand:- start:2757 stop:4085 length:1329 start_codon:yes stop_codon:yes gene_type:complete
MAETQTDTELGGTILEYPRGISTVPYASFLKITRYEYQEALEKVAANSNDALGAYARSGVMKNLVNTTTNIASTIYNGAEFDSDSSLNTMENSINEGKKNSWWDFADVFSFDGTNKTEIPGGDKEITLPNGETTTWNALKNDKDEVANERRKGLAASDLFVALPEEFQYGYKADWGNTFKMGTMALMADNAAKFTALGALGAGAGAGFTAALSNLQDMAGSAGNIPGVNIDEYAANMAQGAQMATNPFGVNDSLNPTNIAGLGGMAPNENAIQMFSRMGFRQFSFSFSFAARNPKESQDIQTIIEWFKRGMHPGSSNGKGSAVLLTFPDVFVLEPMFMPVDETVDSTGQRKLEVAEEPIQHPMMPKTKICALTSLNVNTTPMSAINTIFDGSIPLVTVELTFDETTALTRMDMEGARTRINNGVDKGFVAASNMANHPDIGY